MTFSPYLKRLAVMHLQYKKRLALAFLGMILTAATEPVVPYLFKVLLDKGFTGKPAFSYWLVPLAVIGLFVVRGASTYLSTYSMAWVSTRLLNDLRRRM